MSPVPPTKKSNRRFMVTALLALAAVLTAYEITVYSLIVSQGDQAVVETSSMDYLSAVRESDDEVEINFQVTNIDAIKEFATIEYDLRLFGAWGYLEADNASTATVTKSFSVQISASGNGRDPANSIASELKLVDGQRIGGFEAPVSLYPCADLKGTGDTSKSSSAYPLDAYCFDVIANTYALDSTGNHDSVEPPPVTWLYHYGSGLDGYTITFERIPYFTNPETDACYDWAQKADSGFPCSISEDANAGYSRVRGRIERASVVQVFTWVVLGMIVLAAGCAILMTISVLSRSTAPALEGLAFLAALLFAVQPLRGALPDAPPVGIQSDVLLFYPAILAILTCLAIQVVLWVRRGPRRGQ